MKKKNIIKLLPVVFVLTGCSQGTKEISRQEFENITKTLKNNYADYSSVTETFKALKVEASGGSAKEALNLLLESKELVPANKVYEVGYSYSNDFAPSYLNTTLAFYQDTSYPNFKATYYSNNNKLSCKYVADSEITLYKLNQEYYFTFDENGLEEYFDLSTTQTYSDNSTLYTQFRTTYTWKK